MQSSTAFAPMAKREMPPALMRRPAGTKVLVVCGPTASGKTALALSLSHLFDGEMVCADSMQIYKGLSIGTAALMPEEAEGIPQHLTAFLPPEVPFSVADYVQAAQKVIADIDGRGKLPVVCGGTGLYIESLVTGRVFTPHKPMQELRQNLQQELLQCGPEHMLRRLAQSDPEQASALHPSDERRILRALEQQQLTGKTYAERVAGSLPAQPPYDLLCLGLAYEDREVLYRRIEGRVDAMMQAGLLEEARYVYMNKNTFATAAQAIGYKEFFPYFEGISELDACVAKLKQATRNYAKRQITWFRHMPQVQWLEGNSMKLAAKAAEIVRNFMKSGE